VLAVDQIDIGTIWMNHPQGLTEVDKVIKSGQRVAVRYPAARPRDARLATAQRSYLWKNPLGVVVTYLVLLCVGWLFVRWQSGIKTRMRALRPKP
jgi:hypothetical protein